MFSFWQAAETDVEHDEEADYIEDAKEEADKLLSSKEETGTLLATMQQVKKEEEETEDTGTKGVQIAETSRHGDFRLRN